jgi:hypothetical protein
MHTIQCKFLRFHFEYEEEHLQHYAAEVDP